MTVLDEGWSVMCNSCHRVIWSAPQMPRVNIGEGMHNVILSCVCGNAQMWMGVDHRIKEDA